VAEQLKRSQGLSSVDCPEHGAGGGTSVLNAADLPTAFSTVLRDSLQDLAGEVGRCFSYVMRSFPELTTSRLYLAGGGAQFDGLAAVLTGPLGIPVLPLAGPFDSGLASGPESSLHAAFAFEPSEAVATGSALLDLETS